ncbi:MAG: hypothetical protein GC168_02765 [Candidatus Hydrogenedens sp.]|nr:hypothetical protein [Candidatus Hydrogenedens sp.]
MQLPRILILAAMAAVASIVPSEPCGATVKVDPLPSGGVSVTTESGAAVFDSAQPRVVTSTNRDAAGAFSGWTDAPFEDALGKGTAYTASFESLTWEVRVYCGLPYVTAQAAYRNTGSEPVFVESLSAWESEGASLGPGTGAANILDNGTLTRPDAQLWTAEAGEVTGLWNLAAWNAETRRSLIAGFLTNAEAYTQLTLKRPQDRAAAAFAQFRAECRYTPAKKVAPGETLSSEVLYLGVDEASPLEGLERFGTSVAEWNTLKPTRRALPHGWDSWASHYHTDIDEASMQQELEAADTALKRYGWTHFSIDDGWQQQAGAWEADAARFPSGMKAFADAVHARGMTAGLWTEPFTVNTGAAVAAAHPDWLLEPNLVGLSLMGKDERVLDVTVPEAYDFLKGVYRTITQDWGYDALVETDFLYHLLAVNAYTDAAATHASALNRGMQAIRDGAEADTFIMGVAPFSIVSRTADGMRAGVDCAPIWRNDGGTWSWGCVDTLTNAARRYYLSPRVVALDQDCAYFGHDETRARWNVAGYPKLTRDQQIAWMTGAALTGGAVKIGDAYSLLTPDEIDILRRLLPVMETPARPVDLFERKDARLWSLPIDSAIGQWQIVAVFNWDAEHGTTESLDLTMLGLDATTEYAVFDFWNQRYCGIARGSFEAELPPGSVRLFSFRRREPHPMLLSTDRHWSQGATDFTALSWNETERTLAGSFDAVADTDYALTFLVPEGYKVTGSEFSGLETAIMQNAESLQVSLHCATTAPLAWSLTF